MSTTSIPRDEPAVIGRLSTLDRFLPAWILAAMVIGLGLGALIPRLNHWPVARTVLIFLGIPLLAGYITRRMGLRVKGREWYEQRFLPRIRPIALYGMLFTIVLLFALRGHQITHHPVDVIRIAVPLLAYFAVLFTVSFAWGRTLRLGYERTATLAFTAAGNNVELAIAVAIGVFGATSGEALAGVVGPLIEVPVLVALVYVSLLARRYFPPLAQRNEPIVADLATQTS